MIIGGDMNCVLDPSKDTRGARSVYKPSNALASVIKCDSLQQKVPYVGSHLCLIYKH